MGELCEKVFHAFAYLKGFDLRFFFFPHIGMFVVVWIVGNVRDSMWPFWLGVHMLCKQQTHKYTHKNNSCTWLVSANSNHALFNAQTHESVWPNVFATKWIDLKPNKKHPDYIELKTHLYFPFHRFQNDLVVPNFNWFRTDSSAFVVHNYKSHTRIDHDARVHKACSCDVLISKWVMLHIYSLFLTVTFCVRCGVDGYMMMVFWSILSGPCKTDNILKRIFDFGIQCYSDHIFKHMFLHTNSVCNKVCSRIGFLPEWAMLIFRLGHKLL